MRVLSDVIVLLVSGKPGAQKLQSMMFQPKGGGGRVVRWSWVNFQCRGVDSRPRAYCACSRCGWGFLDIFSLLYRFSPLSPSLWETARYRLKYCPKGPLNPKQQQKFNLKVDIFCVPERSKNLEGFKRLTTLKEDTITYYAKR